MMPYTGESVIYQNLAEQSKYAKYICGMFFYYIRIFSVPALYCPGLNRKQTIFMEKNCPSVAGTGSFYGFFSCIS